MTEPTKDQEVQVTPLTEAELQRFDEARDLLDKALQFNLSVDWPEVRKRYEITEMDMYMLVRQEFWKDMFTPGLPVEERYHQTTNIAIGALVVAHNLFGEKFMRVALKISRLNVVISAIAFIDNYEIDDPYKIPPQNPRILDTLTRTDDTRYHNEDLSPTGLALFESWVEAGKTAMVLFLCGTTFDRKSNDVLKEILDQLPDEELLHLSLMDFDFEEQQSKTIEITPDDLLGMGEFCTTPTRH